MMATDAHLHWNDPIDQLDSLRIAVKHLRSQTTRTTSLSNKFDAATFPLVKYQSHDFPKEMQPRHARIMKARETVRREYSGGTLFEFSQLPLKERREIENDVFALYEGCLLDIGKMSLAPGVHDYVYGIVYPIEKKQTSTHKPRRSRHKKKSRITAQARP